MKRKKIFAAVLVLTLLFAACAPTAGAAENYKPLARGDVNFDGKLQASDAREALRCAVGLVDKPQDLTYRAFDVDRDEQIKASDARMILRAAVGLDLLSFNEHFYLPLTVSEGPAYSVTLVSVFSEGPSHGFVFDIVNKTADRTLEIMVGNPALNGFMTSAVASAYFMGAYSYIDETLLPREVRTCTLAFDQDMVDPAWFLEGQVRDVQLTVDVFDVTQPGLSVYPSLFGGVCRVYPNRAYPQGGAYLQIPYDNDQKFYLPDAPCVFVQHALDTYARDAYDDDPGLVEFFTEKLLVENRHNHTVNAEIYDVRYCGEKLADYNLPDSATLLLYPGANGVLRFEGNVYQIHAYLSDLTDIQFSLRVWDSETQEIIFEKEGFSVFFPSVYAAG